MTLASHVLHGSSGQALAFGPHAPAEGTVARLRALLIELYGSAAELSVASAHGIAIATVKVPYELV